MVEHGGDLDWRGDRGYALLHHASQGGLAWLVERLLAHGIEVNARTLEAETPLHEAAYTGRLEAAAVLLRHGADVNALDLQGRTPLDFTATPEMVALLRKHGGRAGRGGRP